MANRMWETVPTCSHMYLHTLNVHYVAWLIYTGVSCGAPPPGTNVSPGTPSSTVYQGAVTYTCDTGYRISQGVLSGFAICKADMQDLGAYTNLWRYASCSQFKCIEGTSCFHSPVSSWASLQWNGDLLHFNLLTLHQLEQWPLTLVTLAMNWLVLVRGIVLMSVDGVHLYLFAIVSWRKKKLMLDNYMQLLTVMTSLIQQMDKLVYILWNYLHDDCYLHL